MRRLFLLISLVVISTGWVLAQTNSTDNEATGTGSQATSGSDYDQGKSAAPQSSDTDNAGTSSGSQETHDQGAMSTSESSIGSQEATSGSQAESQGGKTTTGEAPAQGEKSSSMAPKARAEETKTIAGCLSENNGQFTLTDREGNAYQLTGKTSTLKAHVGHEISVTGRMSTSGMNQPGSMSGEQANAMPTIHVTTFKHISSSCQGSSSMH